MDGRMESKSVDSLSTIAFRWVGDSAVYNRLFPVMLVDTSLDSWRTGRTLYIICLWKPVALAISAIVDGQFSSRMMYVFDSISVSQILRRKGM